ncbi:unnamed protein product [Penicillium viridicatum]
MNTLERVTTMSTRSAKSVVEIAAGQNAIKRWILTKGWQRASYMHEPGRGPAGGLLNFWYPAMERIAENDAQFAAHPLHGQ